MIEIVTIKRLCDFCQADSAFDNGEFARVIGALVKSNIWKCIFRKTNCNTVHEISK